MKQRHKGFSLIELIIAISLSAVLSSLIFSFVFLSYRNYQQAKQLRHLARQEVALQETLQVACYSLYQTDDYANALLTASNNALVLQTLYRDSRGFFEHIVRLDLSEKQLSCQSAHKNTPEQPFSTIQINNIQHATLEYHSKQNDLWMSQWKASSQEPCPDLIKLSFQYSNSPKHHELIFEVLYGQTF